jgi:atypical dual specificity phosphatase
MNTRALELTGFGVAFDDRIILSDVSFHLDTTGMTVLVGPAGCGKSTLLRTLSGLNDCHPSLVMWGRVKSCGLPFLVDEIPHECAPKRPSLVMQHARFFLDSVRENLVSALPNRASLERTAQTELVVSRLEENGLGELTEYLHRDAVELPLGLQRRLAIARALIQSPHVLFADEPAAGLDEAEALEVLTVLRVQARVRAVMLVTHNQRYARAADGNTLLLAGGRIQAHTSTREFFGSPNSPPIRHFLRTGGCILASPDVPIEILDECVVPARALPTERHAKSRFTGPRGFFWVLPGYLGGMPRPGIIEDLERDLEGLKRLGVNVLITLEETECVDPQVLSELEIHSVHFPILDMHVPELSAAAELCREVDGWMQRGSIVTFHCRAGLGRTGTMLACQLIWCGRSARDAIETVRAINPRCIQSDAQVNFLPSFANWLKENAALLNPTTEHPSAV